MKSLDLKKVSERRIPSPVQFFPIYMKERYLLSSFLVVILTLSVIITFSFFHISFLLYYLVSRIGRLTSDFELIGGVTVVDTACLSLS